MCYCDELFTAINSELELISILRDKVQSCKEIEEKSAKIFLEMLDAREEEIRLMLCNI